MMIVDLPPLEQERVVCSIAAAETYNIPANALLAVASVEGGKPFLKVRNSNGTYDIGTMQFNTAYIKSLAKYNISVESVAQSGCYPYFLAAWRIKKHLSDDSGEFWQRVANYHSRTPLYNQRYQRKLKVEANKWANWLKSNLPQDQQLVVTLKTIEIPKRYKSTNTRIAKQSLSNYQRALQSPSEIKLQLSQN